MPRVISPHTFFYQSYGYLYLVIALLSFGVFSNASATSVLRLTLPELVERSPMIISAQVMNIQASKNPSGGVTTTISLQILERFKDKLNVRKDELSSSGLLILQQPGGEVGSGDDYLRQEVSGLPLFSKAENVLLFLQRADSGRLVITGLAQGKLRFERTDHRSLHDKSRIVSRRNIEPKSLVSASKAFRFMMTHSPKRFSIFDLKGLISNSIKVKPKPLNLSIKKKG